MNLYKTGWGNVELEENGETGGIKNQSYLSDSYATRAFLIA